MSASNAQKKSNNLFKNLYIEKDKSLFAPCGSFTHRRAIVRHYALGVYLPVYR